LLNEIIHNAASPISTTAPKNISPIFIGLVWGFGLGAGVPPGLGLGEGLDIGDDVGVGDELGADDGVGVGVEVDGATVHVACNVMLWFTVSGTVTSTPSLAQPLNV